MQTKQKGKRKSKNKKKKNKIINFIIIFFVLALVIGAGFSLVSFFTNQSFTKSLYPTEYDEFVEIYAEEYNLEKSFVFAVIKNESDFNPKALSSADARGLMQLLPETFTWLQTKTGEKLDEEMLYDPETSIKYGCMLYRMLIDMFGSKETAVVAYHAGLGNVRKWLKNPEYSSDGVHLDRKIPFPTSEAYVKKVMKTEEIYNNLYN